MLLRHIDNVDERFDQVLQRLRDGVRRRDAILSDIRQSIHADGELHTSLREISNVQYRLMPQYVHRSATLARTVVANASLAERSSKRVRRLDALLQRVQETSAIVDAMKAMENDVAQVSSVLASGDIEATLLLLRSYEEAQRVLASVSPATAAEDEAFSSTAAAAAAAVSNAAPNSDVMRNVRATVQARLLTMIEEAVQVNDKLTIMKGTRLLAELGEGTTASRLYSDWIADHTIAALAKLIDSEMEKMEDPARVAMTHLALVSQCLDNVAAAFENDEEFTCEAFGPQGPLALLTKLHSRATARCVPVLSDFIERRKDVLAQLEKHVSAGDGASAAGTISSGALRASPPPMSATAGANDNAVVASARRADQILEEISHMVSCGYIYLSFVERKQTEYEKRMKSAGAAIATESNKAESTSAATAGEVVVGSTADNLWRTSDNALLNSMQEILAFYVPLQNTYFTIAYDQAVDLQLRAIRDATKEAAAATARAGGGTFHAEAGAGHTNAPAAAVFAPSAATFMSGLQNLYSVAASSADELITSVGGGGGGAAAGASEELASLWYFTHNGQVTLPDDVFFVLRLAIHRAMNTKSAQICSAAVMSAMDVVQLRLLPEIESHMVIVSTGSHGGASSATSNSSAAGGRRQAGAAPHGGFLTPEELHWAGAAERTATYLCRMGDELQQLCEATFSATPHNVTRFRELAGNMRELGTTLQDKQIHDWLDTFADVCCDSVLPPHMERFAAVSYDMKEEVYYHYELNDVWVQACLVDLDAGLQYLHQHLAGTKLFDVLLTAIARRAATGTSRVLLRKRFSLFGALQVDKDVRALRSFFVAHAQNDLTPLRDAFSVLSLMATLLLSDKPTDALEEAANTALTAEEKKKVLLTRVEFRREAVMALPL
ncbi:COG4 transport protein [Leishmania braziliensis]|nr:COG4 transport protein [Leishmania braziliensis]